MKARARKDFISQSVLCIFFIVFLPSTVVAADTYDSQLIGEELERAKRKPDNSTKLEVSLSIELVFDALLTRLAEYSDDVVSIDFDHSSSERIGTLDIGSERITTMADGKRLVQRIIIFEPPTTFAYFTDITKSTVNVPIDYSIGYYEFSEQLDGRVSAEVSVAYKPSSRLTAFLVRLGFSRALSRDFQKAEDYLNSISQED